MLVFFLRLEKEFLGSFTFGERVLGRCDPPWIDSIAVEIGRWARHFCEVTDLKHSRAVDHFKHFVGALRDLLHVYWVVDNLTRFFDVSCYCVVRARTSIFRVLCRALVDGAVSESRTLEEHKRLPPLGIFKIVPKGKRGIGLFWRPEVQVSRSHLI